MTLPNAQAPRGKSSRRRGEALDSALLEAAWEELREVGYSALTFESVAARARTSRAVIYRRWPARRELVLAAIRNRQIVDEFPGTDAGNLRDDLIALLTSASERRAEFAALVSIQMAGYFQETGASPADLREALLEGRNVWMDTILQRAHERGEVNLDRLGSRAQSLPFDLFRHEVLMTQRPLGRDAILEIVDDIVLPLYRLSLSDGSARANVEG